MVGANPLPRLPEWKRALPYAVIWLAVLLFHCYYLFDTGIEGIRKFADSGGYYGESRLSLTSADFWSAARSPGILLFYKYFSSLTAYGQATPHPDAPGMVMVIDDPLLEYAQTAFSIAAWSLLAVACARNGRTDASRLLLFSCPLAFSVVSPVALWNFVALSESFALSCMAVLAAAWMLFLRTGRIAWAVGIAVATAAFASTRDVHVYLLPMIALPSLGLVFAYRHQRIPALAVLSLAVFSGIVFAAMTVSIDNGWDDQGRWRVPFYDVMGKRILPDPGFVNWFTENGMPTNDALLERAGKAAGEDGEQSINRNPELEEFRAWSGEHGRRAYLEFLVSHPVYSITAPARHDWEMYGFRLDSYAHPEFRPLFPTGRTVNAAERRHLLTAGVCVAIIGVVAAIALWMRRAVPYRAWALVPLAMILLSVPHVWLNYHGGGIELERHTVIAVVHGYLGAALLGLYLFDELIARIAGARRRAESP